MVTKTRSKSHKHTWEFICSSPEIDGVVVRYSWCPKCGEFKEESR